MKPTAHVTVRSATPDDTPALLSLQKRLDGETDPMLLEADERTYGVGEQRRRLCELLAASSSAVLVAAARAER
jgi:hypothetical protein